MAQCEVQPRVDNLEADVSINTNQSVFNDFKRAKYHKLTDFIIGEVFRKNSTVLGWTPNSLTDPKNMKALTRGIYAYFDNILNDADNPDNPNSVFKNISDEAYEDINQTILPQFNQFIGEYFKYNSIAKNDAFDPEEDYSQDIEEPGSSEDENENNVSDEETEDSQGKEFDKGGQSESAIKLADKEVKTLFRLIPKSTWNEEKYRTLKQTNPNISDEDRIAASVELFLDNDGLPTTADVGPVFNLLLNRLAGIKDYEKFKNTITSVDTLRIIPEANGIAELLKFNKEDNLRSRDEVLLFLRFYQTFSKPKVQIQSAIWTERGDFLLKDEINGNLNNIRQQFTSNFQLGTINDSVKKYLSKDDLQGFSINQNAIPPKPNTFQDRLDFLSLLGIQFTGRQFLDTPTKVDEFETMVIETSEILHRLVDERLKNGDVLREPIKQLREGFNPPGTGFVIPSEAKSIDRIIEFESRYSKLTPSLSSRNVEGELQYLISLDNQLTAVTYHLNNAESLDALYKTSVFANAKYNPLFERSSIIRYLFHTTGENKGSRIPNRSVELNNLSGLKKQTRNSTQSKLERKLSSKDKLIQDFNMMLSQGRTDVPRTETSNSFYTFSLKGERGNHKYFANNSFLESFNVSGFRKQILNYLNGEIERVNSFDEKKKENAQLPAEYGLFSIFHEALEIDDTSLRDDLKAAKKVDLESDLFGRFMKVYNAQLTRELNNFKQTIDKLGITEQELLGNNIKKDATSNDVSTDAFIRAFIANTLVQNIEFTILYSGDPLFFSKKGKAEFHKRLKGLSSTGDLAATIPLMTEFRNSAYEKNFYNKYSISAAVGKASRDNSRNFQTQTLSEYKQSPDFAYSKNGKDDMTKGIQASLMRRDGTVGRMTEEVIKNEVLAEANDQKPADGQGYISLDFHRELSYRFGFNTNEMEAAYRYEGLIFRQMLADEKKGRELTKDEQNELDNLEALIYANPSKYAIPVIKMTYWGGIENVTADVRAYDKFSTAPLLPSDIRNHPKLKQLATDMAESQVGYVKYQSATKLYATQPIEIENIKNATHDLYLTDLLKLQIKPKSKQKTSTSIPTQMLKLVFSNLFNNGTPTNDKVKELYNRYINTLKDVQKVQTESLLKELGITPDGVDISELSRRLIDQAKSQQLSSNVLQALQVVDGSLAGVLEESGFVKQIIDLVSGIADSRLRRTELAGGDFVLVTNANRSKLGFYEYSEDGTKAAECRISLNEQHAQLLNKIHPDGQPIGTIRRINALLNNKNWVEENKKALTIVLDRVPTQGPNSMDFAIVKEFYSPTMGNVITLPDEIVYKSGTDFDYDKEKVLLPSLDEDGNYIAFEGTTREDINNVLNDLISRKRTLIGDTRSYVKALRQEISDINKVKNREVKQIKKDLQTLHIEEGIYYEFMKEGLKTLRDIKPESFEATNYEEFMNMRQDQFITAIFSTDFDTIKAQFDEDLINYYDTLRQIEDAKNEVEFAINAYSLIKQENINTIYSARESELGELFDLSDQIRQNLKNRRYLIENQGNNIVDTYSQILALPEMFAELVIPNSTRTIKPLAERNAELIGESLELPKNNKVLNYLDNLKVKNIYFEAKSMLGPFAVDNTFLQLMQYLGIDLNDQYYRYGKKFFDIEETKPREPNTINNLLLSSDELEKIKVDDKFKTSLREDIEGYLKQHWDSEAINATVDAAKDPWFALMRINYQNIGVVNLMKNLGYPFHRILDFINQPVIQKYCELIQNGLSKQDAILEVGTRIGIYQIGKGEKGGLNPTAYAAMKNDPTIRIIKEERMPGDYEQYKVSYEKKLSPRKGWQVTAILKKIDNGQKLTGNYAHLLPKLTGRRITPEGLVAHINQPIKDDEWNLKVFAHFVMMDQHNQAFRNFQYYFNFDTTKSSTPTDVMSKGNLKSLLLQEGLYSAEDIAKMESESILSSFVNMDTVKAVFKDIFPIIGRPDVQNTLDELYKQYAQSFTTRNKRDLRNMPKVLNTDLTTSILFNFNIVNGQSFIERNKHLIIRDGKNKTMADRLQALKEQPFYNQLAKQFPVLDQLVVNKYRVDVDNDMNKLKQYSLIENIQLIKGMSETSVETESTIEQFKTLQNYEFTGSIKFSEEDNNRYTKAIQSFVRDLFNTGIMQSGLDKTYIGFSEYIPTEYKRALFKDALDNFKILPPAQFSNFLAKFRKQFRYNNPKYFREIKIGEDGSGNPIKINNPNNYSNRFKNYDIKLNFNADYVEEVLDYDPAAYNGVDDDFVVPETQGNSSVPASKAIPITDITRAKKATKYEFQGKQYEGYEVAIKEYPAFEAYIRKDGKKWVIDSLSAGRTLNITGTTIKDMLPELMDIFNEWAKKPRTQEEMQKMGLLGATPRIEPDNLPPVDPSCTT